MALLGVITHNHSSFTQLTLKYIEKYTDLKKNRVILIDNQSTDSTVEDVKKLGFIDKVIVNDENNLPKAQNILIKEANGEDCIFIPNDVVVGPNWLDLLKEEVYEFDEVGCGSPYMPFDYGWDNVVNEDFSNFYFNHFYRDLREDPSIFELDSKLDVIYGGDFEKFCKDFYVRNQNQPTLDDGLTHLIYYKSWLFDKIGLYDEEYKPWGGEDLDFFIRMNNIGIRRVGSSRIYVHHWLSISDRDRFKDDKVAFSSSSRRLMKKWEFTGEKKPWLGKALPEKVLKLGQRSPYCQFKLREQMLSDEEAEKISASATGGFPYMMFGGEYHPGFVRR